MSGDDKIGRKGSEALYGPWPGREIGVRGVAESVRGANHATAEEHAMAREVNDNVVRAVCCAREDYLRGAIGERQSIFEPERTVA